MSALDHVQRLFPDGGGAGVGNRRGHGVDQRERCIRCADGATLLHDIAAGDQPADDVGPRRLGADARRVLELLLQARVGHETRNALHRLDQFALGIGLGRHRLEGLDVGPGDLACHPVTQRRQHLGAHGGVAILIGAAFTFGLGQHQAPAAGDDLLARSHQLLLAAGEIRHGAVELVVREELGQVMCPDQPVQRPFLLAHGGEIRGFERRDDAVVRRHLAVVPGARTHGAVELLRDRAQRGIGLEQAVEDRRHLGEHAFGQVAGIRARVRRGLMRLVQGLSDLQRLLHVQPKLLGAHLLQGAQVEQQRRAFAHALGLDRHHLGTARGADLLRGLLCDGLLQAAAGVVGAGIGCHPLRGERLTACGQGHVDGPVGHGLEGRDLSVAVYHEFERRGLYTPDRQHAVVAGLPPEHGEQPAEVHAHKPVGARARQRRVIHRQRLGRGPQLGERGADGRIVERRQPQAFDGTAVAAQVDDLACDQFAFAVGVSGDDKLGRLRQKRFDDLELRGGLRLDLDPPLLGNDGQLFQRPALERRVIDLGCCRFDEMADAPGDRDAGAVEAAFTALRGAENPADVFALGGLLAQKQPHVRPSASRCSWSCWDRGCRAPVGAAANKLHAAATAFTRWDGCGGDGVRPAMCESGAAMFGSAWKPVDAGGAIPWG